MHISWWALVVLWLSVGCGEGWLGALLAALILFIIIKEGEAQNQDEPLDEVK